MAISVNPSTMQTINIPRPVGISESEQLAYKLEDLRDTLKNENSRKLLTDAAEEIRAADSVKRRTYQWSVKVEELVLRADSPWQAITEILRAWGNRPWRDWK